MLLVVHSHEEVTCTTSYNYHFELLQNNNRNFTIEANCE